MKETGKGARAMKDEIGNRKLILDWFFTRENPNTQVLIIFGFFFLVVGVVVGLGTADMGVAFSYLFLIVGIFGPQLWWHQLKMKEVEEKADQSTKEEEDFEGFLHLKSLEAWHSQMDRGVDPDEEVQKHYVSILQRHLKVPTSGEMDLVTVQACRNCRCEDYCKSTMDFLKNKKWRM